MEYHMMREPYTSVVLPGSPPEATAPPVDMNDPEYNPYAEKVSENNAAV